MPSPQSLVLSWDNQPKSWRCFAPLDRDCHHSGGPVALAICGTPKNNSDSALPPSPPSLLLSNSQHQKVSWMRAGSIWDHTSGAIQPRGHRGEVRWDAVQWGRDWFFMVKKWCIVWGLSNWGEVKMQRRDLLKVPGLISLMVAIYNLVAAWCYCYPIRVTLRGWGEFRRRERSLISAVFERTRDFEVSKICWKVRYSVFVRTQDFEVRASRSSVSNTERGMQSFAKISHFTATGLG